MKAMKICADGTTAVIEIANELEALQQAVGGHIETVTIATDCCLIVDEEGLLKGKPVNKLASTILPIVGDALVCGVDGDEFCDIPDSAIELIMHCKERMSRPSVERIEWKK